MSDSIITSVSGRAVPVTGDDIDTDRIMPARYLRCVTFEHIGQYTFQDERFDPEGKPKTHPFNASQHAGATVLVVNKNFGCGSSREHAPQGILRWGIRAILGESFAEIFAGNCTAIGLPAVTAPAETVKKIQEFAAHNPGTSITLDLKEKTVSFGGQRASVEMRESARKLFLEGTWDSAATLIAARTQVAATAAKIPYLHWAVGK